MAWSHGHKTLRMLLKLYCLPGRKRRHADIVGDTFSDLVGIMRAKSTCLFRQFRMTHQASWQEAMAKKCLTLRLTLSLGPM